MTIEKDEIKWKLKINNIVTLIEKQISDMDKNRSETKLTDKKSRWYELTLVIALMSATTVLIGAVITLTKLYL